MNNDSNNNNNNNNNNRNIWSIQLIYRGLYILYIEVYTSYI